MRGPAGVRSDAPFCRPCPRLRGWRLPEPRRRRNPHPGWSRLGLAAAWTTPHGRSPGRNKTSQRCGSRLRRCRQTAGTLCSTHRKKLSQLVVAQALRQVANVYITANVALSPPVLRRGGTSFIAAAARAAHPYRDNNKGILCVQCGPIPRLRNEEDRWSGAVGHESGMGLATNTIVCRGQ